MSREVDDLRASLRMIAQIKPIEGDIGKQVAWIHAAGQVIKDAANLMLAIETKKIKVK